MTRVFTTVSEAFEELRRRVKEMPSNRYQSKTYQDKNVEDDENFQTLEAFGVNFKITDLNSIFEAMDKYDLDEDYLNKEFEDRIDPNYLNPGNSYKERPEVWNKFLEEDGRFSYSYNERIRMSLQRAIQELKENPKTRHSIVPIFQQKDIDRLGGKRRVPCSMFYQFLRREGKLHMIYVMRSCDVKTHFLYDVILAILIQDYVANKIGVETGTFNMFISSLHGFKRDLKDVF